MIEENGFSGVQIQATKWQQHDCPRLQTSVLRKLLNKVDSDWKITSVLICGDKKLSIIKVNQGVLIKAKSTFGQVG